MGTFVNLTGRRFGRLTVIYATNKRAKNGAVYWNCLCDCGTAIEVRGTELSNGHTQSCGCFWKEQVAEAARIHNTKHGMRQSMEHRKWCSMKDRCYNPNHPRYKDWGGRGIRVCDRWLHSFENFYADMGPCPPGHTLERKENEGHYEPDNCEWIPRARQARNKRNSKILTLDGVSHCLAEWAEIKGCQQGTLGMRILSGWTDEEALLVPLGMTRKKYYKNLQKEDK